MSSKQEIGTRRATNYEIAEAFRSTETCGKPYGTTDGYINTLQANLGEHGLRIMKVEQSSNDFYSAFLQGKLRIDNLSEQEKIIAEAIIAAREVQNWIWGEDGFDKNPLEPGSVEMFEWVKCFEKRIKKICEIDWTSEHAYVELRKRVLQQAALSVYLMQLLDKPTEWPKVEKKEEWWPLDSRYENWVNKERRKLGLPPIDDQGLYVEAKMSKK
jgi:hypothetical protein